MTRVAHGLLHVAAAFVLAFLAGYAAQMRSLPGCGGAVQFWGWPPSCFSLHMFSIIVLFLLIMVLMILMEKNKELPPLNSQKKNTGTTLALALKRPQSQNNFKESSYCKQKNNRWQELLAALFHSSENSQKTPGKPRKFAESLQKILRRTSWENQSKPRKKNLENLGKIKENHWTTFGKPRKNPGKT